MTSNEWVEKCNHWKSKWPMITEEHLVPGDEINMYAVYDAINKYSKPSDIIMSDAGSSYYISSTAIKNKKDQRIIMAVSQADMGWALPAAIGVTLESKTQTLVIVGDGSFMSNLQELAVVKQHNLNIKFIVLNNSGYSCIRNTQTKYYEGRVYGTSSKTGLWFPTMENVAKMFEIDWTYIGDVESLNTFKDILDTEGPMIVECKCHTDQEIIPAQGIKNGKQAGLHDMYPHLSDEELKTEMIVQYE